MVQPRRQSEAPKNPAQEQPAGTKYFSPSKPNFVKLRQGESYEGIYLGMAHSQYGPVYKFKDDKGEIFSIGGNRAQIDQLFTELSASPQGFIGNDIVGHYLVVERLADTVSKSQRKVAVYRIGHVLSKCPKGCK
jgi:hypothetical protein